MRGLIGSILILETAYSTQSLHVGIETPLTYKRKSRPDEEGILPNVRRCKNVDKMSIGFYPETMPQISIAIDSKTLDISSTVVRYGERKAGTYLYVSQTLCHGNGLAIGRYRQAEHKNKKNS